MQSRLLRLLLTFVLASASAASRADLLYRIDIDTQTLTGGTGLIELSLAGLIDSPFAEADLRVLDGNGLAAVVEQFGNVSGDLSSTLHLASDMGFVYLLQELSFGDVLSLQLRLTGDWLDTMADAGLTFAIKLWSEDFQSLLSLDETGDLLRLQLLPANGVQVELLSEFANVRPLTVPAPTALALLAFAGLLLTRLRAR